MNIDVKGVHYQVTDNTKEYLDKKLKRLNFASDLVVDLLLTLKSDKNGYKVEANINFRWGQSFHMHAERIDLFEGIDVLVDKLDMKFRKEKERIQEH